MPDEMRRLPHDPGNHMSTIAVAIGPREYDNAEIQRILPFVNNEGFPKDRKFMRLGRNDLISEIFNNHIGEQFLAHTFDGGFYSFVFHVLKINF